MSLRSFLHQGMQLCRQLTMHHTIEEQYFFPPLAARMPAFAQNDHLISQHERIHEGLVRLEAYLDECRSGLRELRLPELKDVMDSFGEVLWAHLDDEVRMLGAENMRRYWSKEEVAALNIQ
jgi:hemerythrin-like domain-containing protein